MQMSRQALRGSRKRCVTADQIIATGSTKQTAMRLATFCSVVEYDGSFDIPSGFAAKRFQIRKA
jgi:hypothetical protein